VWPWLFNPAFLLTPVLKPLARLVVGLIAIPLFRVLTKYILRVEEMDKELQQDLEQWFKATLVLLIATRNMEEQIFGWIPNSEDNYFLLGLRLMMVIGVIESMPDQSLFSIIHPGPPRPYYNKTLGIWKCIKLQFWPQIKGLICQHLNRSSPVFAFLSAIVPGTVGWVCFGMGISQYLIIGLVTSRDRALDVLKAFDDQVAIKRQELELEFGVKHKVDKCPETKQPHQSLENKNEDVDMTKVIAS
jgi:hypothetical protein